MRFSKIAVIAVTMSCCLASPSNARLIPMLSYQELLEKSDFVVIATPIVRTADTQEKAFLPGIFRNGKAGEQLRIDAIGVETAFKTAAVLKGDTTIQRFTLHHYREATAPALEKNGPNLLSFDPEKAHSFLMFLVREADGRFAPTGGQTDLGLQAITALPRDVK